MRTAHGPVRPGTAMPYGAGYGTASPARPRGRRRRRRDAPPRGTPAPAPRAATAAGTFHEDGATPPVRVRAPYRPAIAADHRAGPAACTGGAPCRHAGPWAGRRGGGEAAAPRPLAGRVGTAPMGMRLHATSAAAPSASVA